MGEEERMKGKKREGLMREGREKTKDENKNNLKRKLAKVSATFKVKRIDLPENRVRGKKFMGWYEVYQLLFSYEQQLLTARPQPSSCFIS